MVMTAEMGQHLIDAFYLGWYEAGTIMCCSFLFFSKGIAVKLNYHHYHYIIILTRPVLFRHGSLLPLKFQHTWEWVTGEGGRQGLWPPSCLINQQLCFYMFYIVSFHRVLFKESFVYFLKEVKTENHCGVVNLQEDEKEKQNRCLHGITCSVHYACNSPAGTQSLLGLVLNHRPSSCNSHRLTCF